MSKKPQKQKFRIGTIAIGQAEIKATVKRAIEAYTYSAQKLMPLFTEKHLGAAEAIVMIACYTDSVMMGMEQSEKHSMTEEEIEGASLLLLGLWKQGRFQPPPDYPYTLEETLALFEDRSEVEA